MSTVIPARSAWLSTAGQTREDTRVTPLGTYTPTSAVASRSGVLPGSTDTSHPVVAGFALTEASAMAGSVAPGRAVIQTGDSQGAYPVALSDAATLTFASGGPQDRVDLVVLQVFDGTYDGGPTYAAEVTVIPGTSGSTAAPAVPAMALPLYSVIVRANASAGTTGINWTGDVTDLRTSTVAVGGILPSYGPVANGAYTGQYMDSGSGLQRWNGSAWTAYPAVPTWQNWTPVWSTVTGTSLPSYGNAVLNCRYIQDGPTVHLSFDILFGSTTNFGSGATGSSNWTFSLPVPVASTVQCVGFAELDANSILGRCIARMRPLSTTTIGLEVSSGRVDAATMPNTGLTDSVTPWTWAANDFIRGTATYEAGINFPHWVAL